MRCRPRLAASRAVLAGAAGRLALATSAGHLCIPLAALIEGGAARSTAREGSSAFAAEMDGDLAPADVQSDADWTLLPWTGEASAPQFADELRHRLLASGVVVEAAQAIAGASAHPLVLDSSDRLYLRRHFDQERALARALVARAPRAAAPVQPPPLLETLFPPRARVHPRWQKPPSRWRCRGG